MNKKTTLLALIALSALAAACHEQRQDPPPDYDAVRAHANEEHRDLQQQKAPQNGESR